MPAAAGDGLLGEPVAPGGGGGGAEDAARPAAACEGSFLPAWVSGVPRERLRDFQHHKRVGNYLIGSRKLGEGSFAKVREGLHVLTGEKVSEPPGAPPLGWGWGVGAGRASGDPAESTALGVRLRRPYRAPPVPRLSSRVERGIEPKARRPSQPGCRLFPRGDLGPVSPGAAGFPAQLPAAFVLLEGRRLADTSAGVGLGGSAFGASRGRRGAERQDPAPEGEGPDVEGERAK